MMSAAEAVAKAKELMALQNEFDIARVLLQIETDAAVEATKDFGKSLTEDLPKD